MEKINSSDGTQIAFSHTGAGPPLILVHGTTSVASRWAPLIPTLEESFSVFAVDRRGRGESGDGEDYAIHREFEDIAAVIDATEQPANLLGHSFGGLCSLEASLLTGNIRKLVLYEPPLPLPGKSIIPEGLADRLQALLDDGDHEELLTTFYREAPKIPPQEIEKLKTSPAWPARVETAHTLPREMRALDRYTFDPQRFKDLDTPTLLLLGGDSPSFVKSETALLDATLPNSRIAVMEGQQHIAMDTAPDVFLGEILGFLLDE
jgi:pimeloyl-ACP methyl ester carboxylesterase